MTIGEPTQYGYVELDAKALLRKLGWTRPAQPCARACVASTCGSSIPGGNPGNKIEHRLDIALAVGDSKINGEAEERITRDRRDDCQYDLAFEGKIVRKR